MGQSLYIIDGHAHLYAAFFAIGRLNSPTGEPTNAVFGFLRVLLKILRDRKPDHIAVAFDPPGPTFRDEEFADYKANRKPMPDDLLPQVKRLPQVLEAMGVPVFVREGFEADDVIGTLAAKARAAGIDVFVCSRDKDMGQLLSPGTAIYDAKNDVLIDAEKWTAEKGIRPDQVVDWLALMGDASDNIPGAKGIGEKTAAKLISEFGTLDNLLANLDKLKGKQKENIEAYAPQAPQSKRLATIRCDLPIDVDLNTLRPKPVPPATTIPLFRELGFNTLLTELFTGEQIRSVELGAGPPRVETPFHRLIAALGLDKIDKPIDAPKPAPLRTEKEKVDYRLVDTPEALAEFVALLGKQSGFSFDTETTGTDPMADELVGLSFAFEPGRAYYLPVMGLMLDRKLPLKETIAALKPIFADPAIRKCGQNVKFDMVVLNNHGINEIAGVDFDTMIAAYCLDPARREVGIDSLALDFFGHKKIGTLELLGKGRKQVTMADVLTRAVADYAGEDADYALRLRHLLEPRIESEGLHKLFVEVEMPLVQVLLDMERRGITVDPAVLKGMSGALEKQLDVLRGRIFAEAGVEFNIDSPKQLAEVLFDKLALKRGRRTAGGQAATDVDVLEQLADEHAVPGLVLEYRQLAKLKGTYVDALPLMIHPRTKRVHTKFNQTGAQTGRLSSSDPNLQNIPIRTELGRSIRAAFTAEAGKVLLTADYSQIELRLLAHFSGDEALLDAFRSDRDIHRFVAAQVFGVPEDKVDSDMRRKAKAVNFGIIYGQTPFGLSRATGMSVGEARTFINEYFRRYPRVRQFIDDCIRLTSQTGVAPTILGRRRRVDAIHSSNRAMRGFGERLAVNTVLQGSAADLIKTAMVGIDRRIKTEGRSSRMLLQIHDELVFEVPEADVEREKEMVVAGMDCMKLDVPLKVDVAWGRNWLETGQG